MGAQGIFLQVEGLDKALRKLDELKKIDRSKARDFKRGIRKSAKPLVTAMKSRIKDSNSGSGTARHFTDRFGNESQVGYKPGNLRRSISFLTSKNKRALIGYVGARFGSRAGKTYDGYYAAIVNYGTKRGGKKGLNRAKGKYFKAAFSRTAALKNRRNVNYVLDAYKAAGSQVEAEMTRQVKHILNNTISQLARK